MQLFTGITNEANAESDNSNQNSAAASQQQAHNAPAVAVNQTGASTSALKATSVRTYNKDIYKYLYNFMYEDFKKQKKGGVNPTPLPRILFDEININSTKYTKYDLLNKTEQDLQDILKFDDKNPQPVIITFKGSNAQTNCTNFLKEFAEKHKKTIVFENLSGLKKNLPDQKDDDILYYCNQHPITRGQLTGINANQIEEVLDKIEESKFDNKTELDAFITQKATELTASVAARPQIDLEP